jgi:hypothetical protein
MRVLMTPAMRDAIGAVCLNDETTQPLDELAQAYDNEIANLTLYADVIDAARQDRKIDDDLEIDDCPSISQSGVGVWVSFWIYVSTGETES